MWSTRFWRSDAGRGNVVGAVRGRHAKHGSRRPRRLGAESLERRQLMSVSPILPDAAALSAAGVVRQDYEVSAGIAAPVATDDAYAVNGHQQLGANVLANDVYAEGTSVSVALQGAPSHGALNLGADGLFTYVPDRNFDGIDTFTYQFNDGQADSNVATVSIQVARVNDAPVAVNDSFHTEQDQPLVVPAESGLLANDRDANGDPLTASLVDGPQNGTLTLQEDGSFTYAPNPGFHGADTFTYKANDGQVDSNLAIATIAVGPVNSSPVAVDDAFQVDEDQVLSVSGPGVLANDTDANSDALDAILITGPHNGTLVLGADGSFDYTPKAGFHGADSFTYKANDGQADSLPATVAVTINPVNHLPTADDDSYATDQEQTLNVPTNGVLGNDVDGDGDSLTAALVNGPTNGTLTLNADGSFQYTPNAGFNGTDSFTYTANDGQADSLPATVAITINPVNHAPTAADDSYATDQGQTLTVPTNGVLANDVDVDGDSLTATLVNGPTNGTLTLNADGSFQYAPNAGFNGADSFTYKANDGQADSLPATVAITVNPIGDSGAKELKVHLETSDSAFGAESGPIWGGSTFWVSAYVEDLRDLPQGVVGGAIDVQFDAAHVTPTGNVVYGTQFTDYHQGAADAAAGLIDEAGALTTEAGVGTHSLAPFVAWEFRRNGPGAPDDANSQVTFAAEPGQGTATILPANFALVGLGTAVDWKNVEFDTASLNLNLGDFNGDGSVNQYDLALWIPHATSAAGDGAFDPMFDLNGDARVDAGDLALLMPRLYRPVLGDALPPAPADASSLGLGESVNGLQSYGLQNRVAAFANRGAAFAQLAASRWNAVGEGDLEWGDALAALRPQMRNTRHLTAAVDRVLEGYESRVPV